MPRDSGGGPVRSRLGGSAPTLVSFGLRPPPPTPPDRRTPPQTKPATGLGPAFPPHPWNFRHPLRLLLTTCSCCKNHAHPRRSGPLRRRGAMVSNLVRFLLLKTPAATAEGGPSVDAPLRGEEPGSADGDAVPHRGDRTTTDTDSLLPRRRRRSRGNRPADDGMATASGLAHKRAAAVKRKAGSSALGRVLTLGEAVAAARGHPVPCAFALFLLFFMGVEYTLRMVPSCSPPFDVGFLLTGPLHRLLAVRPVLNSALAALNTVFVGMQAAYILWTLLLEGRPRATISALFMFTCRGILGYSTQLPLPQEFLGSGADFPVANVSFFLFFSGHVAGSVIASLDMRRTGRRGLAGLFDALNVLQVLRLLATRGHYTIDLAAGVGAGFLFDVLAGMYEECRAADGPEEDRRSESHGNCCACACHG